MSGLLSCLMLLGTLVCNAIPVELSADSTQGVFLTPAERSQVLQRVETEPWAAAIKETLLDEAESLVSAPLDIPHKEGQWPHWYTCKEDGGRLQGKSPTEHVCPICGKVYSGWPYDEVYVGFRHGFWLGGIETLGWAYTLDPKPAYAERARDILLEYASFYKDLRLHDVHDKQSKSRARLYAQTLDSAVVLCKVCVGYDLLRNSSCFTDEVKNTIETKLLRPMVETISANDSGISNWQSWHNAAVGCAGFVLGDEALADWAINGKSGFAFQMKRSVMPSGMWYEESPSYHWYALYAHVFLMEAAARAGVDLYGLPIVKKLFDAPIRQLFPDQTFPALHDSSRGSIIDSRKFYEIAWKHYGDTNYLSLLQPRDTPWALFWGADTPDAKNAPLTLKTSNSKSEGLAILRDETGSTALYLDYGPGKSGHVQPAKLNIILYADGEERFVDPGRLAYGNPLHKGWYRQTVAHNTVVVDGKSQKRSPGKLEAFENTPEYALIRAKSKYAYKGVTLDRTVIMQDHLFVDIFQCTADSEQTFDLPLHIRGTFTTQPETKPASLAELENGYDRLQDVEKCNTPWRHVSVKTSETAQIDIEFLDTSETYIAKGFGKTPQEMLPLILRRQTGDSALFAAVYFVSDNSKARPTVNLLQEEHPVVVLGDLRIHLGEDTVVEKAGEKHTVPPSGDA